MFEDKSLRRGDSKPLLKPNDLLSSINTSINIIKWMSILTFVSVTTLLIVMLALGVGAYSTSDQLTKTTEATEIMKNVTLGSTEKVNAYIDHLFRQFPDGEDVRMLQTAFSIAQSADVIMKRAAVMSNTLNNDAVEQMVEHLKAIAEKTDRLVQMIQKEHLDRAFVLLDRIQELVGTVSPEQVAQMVSQVQDILNHANSISKEAEDKHSVSQATDLMEQASGVLKHLNKGEKLGLGF